MISETKRCCKWPSCNKKRKVTVYLDLRHYLVLISSTVFHFSRMLTYHGNQGVSSFPNAQPPCHPQKLYSAWLQLTIMIPWFSASCFMRPKAYTPRSSINCEFTPSKTMGLEDDPLSFWNSAKIVQYQTCRNKGVNLIRKQKHGSTGSCASQLLYMWMQIPEEFYAGWQLRWYVGSGGEAPQV